MKRTFEISLFSLVMGLSDIVDLVSPMVFNHHKKVAYIAYSIAAEMNLPAKQVHDIVLAGAIHDIGTLCLQERLRTLNFELENPHLHAYNGYRLLKMFKPLEKVANKVLYHHVRWDKDKETLDCNEIPLGSYIIHLADRIAVLIDDKEEILGQVQYITEKIEQQSGHIFKPELVEVFKQISIKECFWLEVTSRSIETILSQRLKPFITILDLDGLDSLGMLFSQVIDFRSSYTSTHSSGVAAVAEILAEFIGASHAECRMVKIAGYLHDLGKLSIPSEVLEKPGKLTRTESNIIKKHTFYTHSVLSRIECLNDINKWASFHHECLDGSGYPFHLKGNGIPILSRVMAVADVFTAIMEDRPYRKGMSEKRALKVLENMALHSKLDGDIVMLLKDNFSNINYKRNLAQQMFAREYRDFSRKCSKDEVVNL